MQVLEVNRDIKTDSQRIQGTKSWEDTFFVDHWLGIAEDFSAKDLISNPTSYLLYPAWHLTFAEDMVKNTLRVS
jgi:hypothetical protein